MIDEVRKILKEVWVWSHSCLGFLLQYMWSFIKFNDLGGLTLKLSDFLPKRFDPLIDRLMTKPQHAPYGPKAQPFQVQGQCQAALVRSRRN